MTKKRRRRHRRFVEILFGPLIQVFSLICLFLSIFLPVNGLGIDICWFKHLYELPCPGCGLTRCVTCITQGQWIEAVRFHALGPVIYLVMVTNIVLLTLPLKARRSLFLWLIRHDSIMKRFYFLFVTCFLIYGVLRAFSAALDWQLFRPL